MSQPVLTEAEVDAMLDRLLALGIVEDRDGHVRTSRRWNGRLQSASQLLNREAALSGRNPPGNPLVLCVERALEDEGVGFAGRDREVAVHVLVLLELSVMRPGERERLGWGKLALPADEG